MGVTGGLRRQFQKDERKKWAKRIKFAVPLLAVLATIWVATQGQITLDHNSRFTLQQSEDAQLSTAITSIGSSDTAEKIAGLLLLTRNTSSRFTLMGETKEAAAGVFDDYTTALQILGGYLNSHGQAFLAGSGNQVSASFGRGYGVPPPPGLPDDVVYAADQVKLLLAPDIQGEVAALNIGTLPAIDLSRAELFGQPWTRVNLENVKAYMPGIDLRGASLESSQWSATSDLSGAYFQCANLQKANFHGADLTGAHFEGAYVQGADFRGAKIKGAVFTQLYGTALWSQQPPGIKTLSAHRWKPSDCQRNPSYWHGQPAAVSAPASAQPSSSPTAKPGSGSTPNGAAP